MVAITDLESIAPKKKNEHKQDIQKMLNKWLPNEKLMTLDKSADALNILRRIGGQKRKSVTYRDRRPHIYAETVEYTPNETGADGTLKLTGYLRGTSLNVNSLIHIPGLGDFQMSQIDALADPYTLSKNTDGTARIVAKCDPSKQESLDTENVPDPMDAEQTWPTDEEVLMAQQEERQKLRKVKKVPKGWSEYQAAWIPDEESEMLSQGSDDDEEEDEGSSYMDAVSEERSEYSDAQGEEFDTMTESEVAANDQQYDNQMDFYAERTELQKLKAAKADRLFPDEIDTPQDMSARARFQKYRGLESFR